MKNKKAIRAALSAATCALLNAGISTNVHAEDQESSIVDKVNDALKLRLSDEYETDIGASSLLYSELGRVTVLESAINLKHEITDDEFLTGKFITDIMTGASPSGASSITGEYQSITSPSGYETRIKGGETPTFDFRDFRTAFSLGWLKPLTRTILMNWELTNSQEKDYGSLGTSLTFNFDLFNRMTTLSVGAGGSVDEVEPEARIPQGLSPIDSVIRIEEEESKQVLDALVGVTQVLNRSMLAQVNYSIGRNRGYLTDPYKILSYIDSETDSPVEGGGYYFEKRPDERLRQTIFIKYMWGSAENVLDLSYRYYWDDWEIKSHTINVLDEYTFSNGWAVQLHGRYYQQSKASFYHYSLYNGNRDGVDGRDVAADGPDTLDAASGDYRLGALNTYTTGIKISKPTDYGLFSLRAEYMYQKDRENKFQAVNAGILQFMWRLKFY